MAKIEFNIQELYKYAFGYIGMPFPLGDLSAKNLKGSFNSLKSAVLNRSDALGRSFFMPIKLNDVWLPNSPLMSITASKRIKSTPVAGGDGTVKELLSIDDYSIRIRGFAINFEDNDYPHEDVELLSDLFQINKSIPIYSDLCEIFGINNVVIETMNFPEMVGVQNVQAYEIGLLSDKDFEVIIN